MNGTSRVEKIAKKNKLSYREYEDRYTGNSKRNKQKRGKVRFNESAED